MLTFQPCEVNTVLPGASDTHEVLPMFHLLLLVSPRPGRPAVCLDWSQTGPILLALLLHRALDCGRVTEPESHFFVGKVGINKSHLRFL